MLGAAGALREFGLHCHAQTLSKQFPELFIRSSPAIRPCKFANPDRLMKRLVRKCNYGGVDDDVTSLLEHYQEAVLQHPNCPPYVLLVQSSGYGKTTLAAKAVKIQGGMYICLRDRLENGWPTGCDQRLLSQLVQPFDRVRYLQMHLVSLFKTIIEVARVVCLWSTLIVLCFDQVVSVQPEPGVIGTKISNDSFWTDQERVELVFNRFDDLCHNPAAQWSRVQRASQLGKSNQKSAARTQSGPMIIVIDEVHNMLRGPNNMLTQHERLEALCKAIASLHKLYGRKWLVLLLSTNAMITELDRHTSSELFRGSLSDSAGTVGTYFMFRRLKIEHQLGNQMRALSGRPLWATTFLQTDKFLSTHNRIYETHSFARMKLLGAYKLESHNHNGMLAVLCVRLGLRVPLSHLASVLARSHLGTLFFVGETQELVTWYPSEPPVSESAAELDRRPIHREMLIDQLKRSLSELCIWAGESSEIGARWLCLAAADSLVPKNAPREDFISKPVPFFKWLSQLCKRYVMRSEFCMLNQQCNAIKQVLVRLVHFIPCLRNDLKYDDQFDHLAEFCYS